MKKYRKHARQMTEFSLFSGIGTGIITRAGGSGAGMANLTRFSPTMGTAMGAGGVLRSLGKLVKRRK